jgi:hypothetical protein
MMRKRQARFAYNPAPTLLNSSIPWLHKVQSGAPGDSASERFQPVDLSFGLAIAPAFSQCVFDGGDIPLQRASKALHGVNVRLLGIIKPDLILRHPD